MKTREERIIDRDEAIKDARWIIANKYIILDTETTGLTHPQMCQLAFLQSDGKQFKSLVKPTVPIESRAQAVHHITNEMVQDAPTADKIAQEIPQDIFIVIYNSKFDIGVMENSLKALNIFTNPIEGIVFDAMQIYSNFDGEWSDFYGNYKWHKLEVACNREGIKINVELHDALSDCIMTDRLIHYIAEQKLSTEV